MNKAFISMFLLIVLTTTGVGLWFWRDMQAYLNTPLILTADIDFKVTPGMSLQAVCRELQRRELMSHSYYLLLEARLLNVQGQLKAGEYVIKQGTTPRQLLDQFVTGKVKQYALTLIEGWTFTQIMQAIKNNGHLVQTLNISDKTQATQALEMQEQNPEGLFFPDTYYFPANTSDAQLLRTAHARLQKILDEEWRQRSSDLPYTSPYEALIMASLIEKETSLNEERSMIAGVFIRRLRMGMPLQTDPTIIYAMQDTFDGNIRKRDMDIDSPYNTYTNNGLPPTPIAIAGRDSIHAALHPDNGRALYFVAKGGGAHHFSESLSEHNEAVAKYQLQKKTIK